MESTMPGDDLIATATQVGTRAITIDAEPGLVFDFIAQMGFGRAGWYSYDWLDNLGRRSATSLNEAWAVREAGETVPGGPLSFVAALVDRPSQFVLQLPARRAVGHSIDFTLAYRLDSIGAATRLVSRVRIAIDGFLGSPSSMALLLGDGAMIRKQLLGIKQRCER